MTEHAPPGGPTDTASQASAMDQTMGMGLVIAVMLLAMYLPLFEAINAVRA